MVAKNTSIRALASIFPSIIFDGKRFLILTRLFEFSINVCKHCQQVWWRLLNHQTGMLVLLKFKSTLADVVSQTFTKSQAWLKTQPQYKRWFQCIINCQKISSLKYIEAIMIDYPYGLTWSDRICVDCKQKSIWVDVCPVWNHVRIAAPHILQGIIEALPSFA